MSRKSLVMKKEEIKLLVEELEKHAAFERIEEKSTQLVVILKNLRITVYNPERSESSVFPQGKEYQAFDAAYEKVTGKKVAVEVESQKGLDTSVKHPKCLELDNLPSKDEIEADKQLKEEFIKKINDQVEEDERNGYTVIFTDGSYNEEKHLPSYGAIIYTSEKQEVKGVITEEKYKNQRNYAGEFFAVLKSLEFCEAHNIKKPSFFVDLNNSFKEFYGCFGKLEERKNLSPLTIHFNEEIKAYKQKGFDMKFSWCPGHIEVRQNEAADELARKVLDEYIHNR